MLDRVRSAMLFCFAAALSLLALTVTTRRSEVAALSIAFWIVAMLLMLIERLRRAIQSAPHD